MRRLEGWAVFLFSGGCSVSKNGETFYSSVGAEEVPSGAWLQRRSSEEHGSFYKGQTFCPAPHCWYVTTSPSIISCHRLLALKRFFFFSPPLQKSLTLSWVWRTKSRYEDLPAKKDLIFGWNAAVVIFYVDNIKHLYYYGSDFICELLVGEKYQPLHMRPWWLRWIDSRRWWDMKYYLKCATPVMAGLVLLLLFNSQECKRQLFTASDAC